MDHDTFSCPSSDNFKVSILDREQRKVIPSFLIRGYNIQGGHVTIDVYITKDGHERDLIDRDSERTFEVRFLDDAGADLHKIICGGLSNKEVRMSGGWNREDDESSVMQVRYEFNEIVTRD